MVFSIFFGALKRTTVHIVLELHTSFTAKIIHFPLNCHHSNTLLLTPPQNIPSRYTYGRYTTRVQPVNVCDTPNNGPFLSVRSSYNTLLKVIVVDYKAISIKTIKKKLFLNGQDVVALQLL